MAASTMVVGGRTDTPVSGQTFFFFAPVFIPLVILGIPILDTAFAIVRRARDAHESGDRRQGPPAPPPHAPRARAASEPCSSSGGGRRCCRAFVLYPTYTHKGDAVVPIGIAALGLALYTLLHPGLREARRADREEAADDAATAAGGGPTAADDGTTDDLVDLRSAEPVEAPAPVEDPG